MNKSSDKALLPSGFYDLLPPDAENKSVLVASLLASFARFGYEQVAPPLMEFEDTLLAGHNASLSTQTFRVMDPLSQAMMGMRADMTMQVVRIAATRLANAPRPLRLSYAGPTLQVTADALRSERQLYQVGAELIGANTAEADAEVIVTAIEALERLGVEQITVDLNLPSLVEFLINSSSDQTLIRQAISRKDVSGVSPALSPHLALIGQLIQAAGPAHIAIGKLQAMDLPPAIRKNCEHLSAIIALLNEADGNITITIDPLEVRGFEYHTGTSFSLFARNAAQEVGRGGHYVIDATGEEATGFTLYLTPLIRIVREDEPKQRLFVPHDIAAAERRSLRERGYTTIHGLAATQNDETEALRLACSHIYKKGTIERL